MQNEIALALAFCHVAPQCILMTSDTWPSTKPTQQHHHITQHCTCSLSVALSLSPALSQSLSLPPSVSHPVPFQLCFWHLAVAKPVTSSYDFIFV